MTSTVVRVKRRLEESPLEALVLHCKRPRTDNQECSPSVFIFSGTVNETETEQPIKKSWLKQQHKSHILDTTQSIPNLVNKLKEEHKTNIQEKRIKILNYSRGLSLCCEDVEGGSNDSEGNQYALLDLYHTGATSDQDNSSAQNQYVYDLYTSQQDQSVDVIDDIERIVPYYGDLVFGSYRDNGLNPGSDADTEDDEDSNHENNWRNDYPDTDNSIDEEDMRNAMGNCYLEDTLSSDAGEEEMVYGADKKTKSSYRHVNPDDVDRYGLPYALYKSKLTGVKNLSSNGQPSLIDCYGEGNAPSDEESDDFENDHVKSYDGESGSDNDEY